MPDPVDRRPASVVECSAGYLVPHFDCKVCPAQPFPQCSPFSRRISKPKGSSHQVVLPDSKSSKLTWLEEDTNITKYDCHGTDHHIFLLYIINIVGCLDYCCMLHLGKLAAWKIPLWSVPVICL